MKRRKILFVTLLLLFGIIIVNIPQDTKNTKIIINERKQNIVSSNAISMMYETEVGSGEYQTSTDTTWPSSGYIFNERLSKCENGGTLSWNEETKRVIMQTNTSDKCYVYFDKYAVPTISEISVSKTYNSISLTVDATKGNNEIVKYYYSKDNGNSYEESASNSYTFNGLTPNLEYKIKVYVEDNLGYTSNIYETAVTTNAYVNPSVTNVTTSNITADSITLNVTASGGTNNVATYYYSKDNGSSYVSSTSSSYTFSGLSAETTYNFKVYVKDSAGYSSGTKSISATTDKGILIFSIKDTYTGTAYNYYFENGMSIAQWTESDYNTNKEKIGCVSGNFYYIISDSSGRPINAYTSCDELLYEGTYTYDSSSVPDVWR